MSTREELEDILGGIKSLGEEWRLYDFVNGQAIVRLPLSVYKVSRSTLESGVNGVRSLTASGKIRLVRERLGIEPPPRRR